MCDIKHNCMNCDYRHFSCPQDSDFLLENCPDFVLGKCFYCAMYALNDSTVCNDVFYPCGCENFKEGNNYEEYLNSIKDDMISGMDSILKQHTYHKKLEHEQALSRRKNDIKHKKKLFKKAKESHYLPGPYYDEDKGRVIMLGRGKRSKYLKQLAHRKVRRDNVENGLLYQHGQHKKLFDYWWELY